jgi:hypothetical protein
MESCVMILLDGLILGRVAVSVAVSSLIMWTGVADYGTASVRGRTCCRLRGPAALTVLRAPMHVGTRRYLKTFAVTVCVPQPEEAGAPLQ